MLPIENMIDYSVADTPSENVSILKLNINRELPSPFQDDIGPKDTAQLEILYQMN